MKKTISILGSTGSIGLTSLDIINNKKNYFQIELLSANKNFNLICKQIKNYNPKIFVITNLTIFKAVKKKYKKKLDITISAIPGIVGLLPTLKMIKLSKKLLIANKESVICGWNLIKQKSIKYKTKIVPVDSEHFSILKLMENHSLNEIKKIYITASGGPFLNYKDYQMKKIKPKEALKHPKWKMGKKISIDSSTLMNKIFEFVEAQKLFGIPKSKLDILIHPESLVHAIIKFKNGLTKFIYHETTMIIPLANAIFSEKLDISDFFKNKKKIVKIESLTFKKVDAKIFPVIKILDKINKFPSTSIIINASNEILVDQFLQKKIPFLAISKIIMNILNDRNYKKYAIRNPKNINQINAIDNWARDITMKKLKF